MSAPVDDRLRTALEGVRGLVQEDGGDLAMAGFDAGSGTLSLQLVLEGAECAECVMPREFLESIVRDEIAGAVPEVAAVQITDPREDDGPAG